jgi:hypothetical protein
LRNFAALRCPEAAFLHIADNSTNRSTTREQSASQRAAYFSGDTSDSVHSSVPFNLDQRAGTGVEYLLPSRETPAKQQTANEHESTLRKRE